MFLATGSGSILGNPNGFKKEYSSKFWGAKIMKTLVITSQKYYIGYAFVNIKNRKLRSNLLLILRATFSRIRAWCQRYPLDPLINAPDKKCGNRVNY